MRIRKTLGRVVFALGLCSVSISNASPATCAALLGAVQKIRDSASPNSWIMSLEPSQIRRSSAALERLDSLLRHENAEEQSLLFRLLLQSDTAVKALELLSGADLRGAIRHSGNHKLVEFISNGIIFRLFYGEYPTGRLPVEVYEERLIEIESFVGRLEKLHFILRDQSARASGEDPASIIDRYSRQYFGYFINEGAFSEGDFSTRGLGEEANSFLVGLKRNIPQLADAWPISSQGLRQLYQEIYFYRDPALPPLSHLRPVEWAWEWYAARKRSKAFERYQNHLLAAMSHLKKSNVQDFIHKSFYLMRGMEAFWTIFLRQANNLERHYSMVNLSHYFNKFVESLIAASSDRRIDGDVISKDTFERIQTFCERLSIPVPAYLPGKATSGELDPHP